IGILKSGAAYVPIDPKVPVKRQEYILENSGAKIMLVDKEGSVIEDGVKRITLKNINSTPPSILRELSTPSPEDIAYVIYTSGTTGNPKGVGITHHNVLRLFKSTHQTYGFTEKDKWVLFHSYAFDVSVWEIWGALLHGGSLEIPSYEQT